MIFYHYTDIAHIKKIFSDGFLKVCEANISPVEARIQPDVVWLFKKPWVGQVPKMLPTKSKSPHINRTKCLQTLGFTLENRQAGQVQ